MPCLPLSCMTRLAASTLGVTLLLGAAPARSVETEFYNGVQALYITSTPFSDVGVGELGGRQALADVFAVSAFGPGALEVNTITWLGGYLLGNTAPASETFSIRFYDTFDNLFKNGNLDPAGLPIHSFTVANPWRVDSGYNTNHTVFRAPKYDLYHYTAVLPQTLRFDAGKSYALSIFTDSTADADDSWVWAGTNSGHGFRRSFYRAAANEQAWAAQGIDLAFNLGMTAPVPEPSTTLLMLAGAAGLAARRWRQRAVPH